MRPNTTTNAEEADGNVLDLLSLLKEEHVKHVAEWWCQLPIVGRARGRWVFHEPPGLGYPRQRARREILDIPSLDDLDLPEESTVERHNKSNHFKPVKGTALEHWKGFCLKSTNAEFQKVPEPDFSFGPSVWFRMFRKSHAGNLRPGALEKIQAWQPTSSVRQRAALSELLWSLNDFLTAKRGVTETKIKCARAPHTNKRLLTRAKAIAHSPRLPATASSHSRFLLLFSARACSRSLSTGTARSRARRRRST